MKKTIFTLAALLIASAAFVACSSSNDEITEQQPVSQTGKYIMTVKASKGDDAATRALSLSGSTLNATWADGEEVSVFEGSTPLGTLRPDPTTINNSDTECTLSGTLDTAPSASGVTLTLKFNSASYSGQDGTLAYIASHCDYAEATTTVTVTTTNNVTTIEGSDADFVNKQAIAKFTLVDKVYEDKLNASKLIVTVDVSDNIKATLQAQKLAALQAQLPTYELNPTTDTYSENGGTGILFLAIPDATTKLAAINNLISPASLSTSDLKFVLTATVDGDTYTLTKNGFPFENGKYYEITAKLTMQPEGVLRGKFSVSSTKQVYFSKGNLQATTSNLGLTWTWAFAANQWDIVGGRTSGGSETQTGNNFITGTSTPTLSANGTVDLFGWSTSTTYLGISNYSNTNNSEYSGDFAEWGLHSDVITGIGTGWYTLTNDEWYYLLRDRSTTSHIRFAKAKVNGVKGLIIFPDNWSDSYYHLSSEYYNQTGAIDFGNIQITLENWTNKFEAHGAVFLPAGGQRNTTDNHFVDYPGGRGYYWSQTSGSNSDGTYRAIRVYFAGNELKYGEAGGRRFGYSVRLVRDVK